MSLHSELPAWAIVIGASAGGVSALLRLARELPDDLDAAMFVVQHVGAHPSVLPELLRSRCRCRAVHARDGERPERGAIYVAPPDRHLLLERDTLRLTRGPKENHARPAIDPLFRSAAVNWGPRVIGVVLTGQLDDGSAGLQAIRDCGGATVVQDPATAQEPGMPRAALAAAVPTVCVSLEDLPREVIELARRRRPEGPAPRPPERLRHELDINEGRDSMEHLQAIGTPSGLSCPDCGGGLFEIEGVEPPRYRCHTGHAYSALALRDAQGEMTEEVLRGGVRALQEKEMLLRRLATASRGSGQVHEAQVGERRADEAREQARALLEIIEKREGGGA